MLAVDTSVVIAGFAAWHDGHDAALTVLDRGPRVPAHVLIESYSVLTRFPPPHRTPPAIAMSFLKRAVRRPAARPATRRPRAADRAGRETRTGRRLRLRRADRVDREARRRRPAHARPSSDPRIRDDRCAVRSDRLRSSEARIALPDCRTAGPRRGAHHGERARRQRRSSRTRSTRAVASPSGRR